MFSDHRRFFPVSGSGARKNVVFVKNTPLEIGCSEPHQKAAEKKT